MSPTRTAAYWLGLVGSLALGALAVLLEVRALYGAAGLGLGITSLVFANELSEHEGPAYAAIPGSRSTRRVLLRVFGAVLAVGGVVALASEAA